MPIFSIQYTVPATLERVAEFHRDPLALRKLSPPPVILQIRRVEPLAEGSISEFTMWFGPFPVRWKARHAEVDRLHGFKDIQVSGPMLRWQHTHHFSRVDRQNSRVSEHVSYEYRPGWRGWWTRLLFSPLSLRYMFAFRSWQLKRILADKSTPPAK
jgi:ligand-binding SRPBCC domain-containing protein